MPPTDPSMPPTMPPSMDPTMPMDPSMKTEVDRSTGSNRITTAIQISNSQFMDGTADSAVIVNGYSLPDALTAPALAGAVEGPVLFTHGDHVSDAVMDELDRLGVERIYLIGGTSVLSTTVQREFANAGFSTKRLSGANRYATAEAVAAKVAAIRGGLTRAFVVNAGFTSAALSASPVAYSQGMPILFTSSTGLPAETTRAIRNLGVDNVTVIGGTSSVSSATYAALTRATTGRLDNRISGSSRFENARLLAEYAVAQGWADPTHVGLVNGVTGFAEGLAGASIIGARNGVVLLVTGVELTRPSQIFLETHGMAGDVEGVHLYGGTGLISDSVKIQVVNLGLNHDTDEDPTDPTHQH